MDKDCKLEDEVEKELQRIEKRYSSAGFRLDRKSFLLGKTAFAETEKLIQELDSLGIETTQANTTSERQLLVHLTTSAFSLIQMYRNVLSRSNDLQLENNILTNTNKELEKKISHMSRDLLEHAELASEAKRKLYVARCDRDSLAKEKKRVEHSLHLTQKLCGMREVQESREVKRMINENEVLRDKLQKNVGSYKSRDEVAVEVIQNYKQREAVYEDTISKLQANNGKLLEEIWNLKEEVVSLIGEKHSQDL